MRKYRSLVIPIVLMFLVMGCASKLTPVPGEVLTDKEIAMDKYYRVLKGSNNTMSNLMANIKLMPLEDQKKWITRVDPIKEGIDSALAGWKLAIGSGNWEDLDANRAEFKRLKNELLDLILDVSKLIE